MVTSTMTQELNQEQLSLYLKPERLEGEEYTAYRHRRAMGNILLKFAKKGTVVWDSSKLGTYKKPEEKIDGG